MGGYCDAPRMYIVFLSTYVKFLPNTSHYSMYYSIYIYVQVAARITLAQNVARGTLAQKGKNAADSKDCVNTQKVSGQLMLDFKYAY